MSLDSDIKEAFYRKYNRQASNLVEQFMRSMLGAPDIDDANNEDEFNSKMEKLIAEKQRINMEFKAVEQAKKDYEKKREEDEKKRSILQRKLDDKKRIEYEMFNELSRDEKGDVRIKKAFAIAQKQVEETISDVDFYINYYNRKNSDENNFEEKVKP